MSETELLQAFRKERSDEAFAELVRRYAGLVYSVAKRRLANPTLAEDVTQSVFIRLANHPPNVRTHAELAAWLHRTTVNVAIDTWRSESRRHNREQQSVLMEPAPEDTVWEEISPKLDDALNQLNDEDRQALLLRFFNRKTMRDVGTALGVSEDAAKMRISRAVDRLRTRLGVTGKACTAAGLVVFLAERSVEAAPVQLLARLAAIKLPAAAGAAGTSALLRVLLRNPRLNLAAGVTALVLIGVGLVHLARPSNTPVPEAAVADTHSSPPDNAAPAPRRTRFGSRNSNTSQAPTTNAVKIMFHVLDAQTGAVLGDSKIHYAFFGPGGEGESHETRTDLNGDAAILEPDDPSKNSGPNVFVAAEWHVPKVVNLHGGAAVPTDYTMKLDPAMTAGGMVVDEQGAPVAGVEIKIQTPGNIPGQTENVDFQTCPVTNRDDGSWRCTYIPRNYTNEIRLILRKPGYAATFPVVPVAKVDLNNLVLVIRRGFAVTGQITDPQNRPIAKASIKTLESVRDKRQSTETDENGIFTLNGVAGDAETDVFDLQKRVLETNASGGAIIHGDIPQGRLQVALVMQADGFEPRTTTVKLLNATNVANFTLPIGNVFRGRVVDEVGNPISNAVVQTDWDNQGIRQYEWQTRTDAEGRFAWDSAPDKPVLFWIEAPGYQVQRDVSLSADGTDHEITLKRNAAK